MNRWPWHRTRCSDHGMGSTMWCPKAQCEQKLLKCRTQTAEANWEMSLLTPTMNPIGSMYGIYANIGGILMGSMLPYMAAPWILWELHTPWHPHLLHLAAGVFQTPAWRWSLSKALPRIVVFLDIFGNWSNYTDSQATSQRKKAGNWNLRTGGYHMLVDQSCFRKLAKLIDMWKYVDYNFWFMVFTKKIDALIKTHDQVTTLGGLLLAEITENWTRIYSFSIFFRLQVSG